VAGSPECVACLSIPNRFQSDTLASEHAALRLSTPAHRDALRYIVAADAVHHLYVSDFAKAYPTAKVIGVEGLEAKRPEVKWDGSAYRCSRCFCRL
jgi:hypothetical protein